jgi:hypothetical protein
MIYSTVNDYLAIKCDGDFKVKGDFLAVAELWKNKSWKIVAMALQEYFLNGINPINYVNSQSNIFDFCLMTRATGQLHLELQKEDVEGRLEVKKLKKLVRYYLTTEKEWKLFKRGIGSTGKDTDINVHAPNELGDIYVKYFNTFEELKDYKIDKNQYIYKILKIIDKIEKTKKLKYFEESLRPQKQISMF